MKYQFDLKKIINDGPIKYMIIHYLFGENTNAQGSNFKKEMPRLYSVLKSRPSFLFAFENAEYILSRKIIDELWITFTTLKKSKGDTKISGFFTKGLDLMIDLDTFSFWMKI